MNNSSSQEEKTQQFLQELEDYNPAVPTELVEYYLKQSGFQSSDPNVTKLIALAGQKFISEICSDSMHYCKIRQQSSLSRDKVNPLTKEKRYVFSTDDLSKSLNEKGIEIKKPEYYTDSSTKNTE
eukprot:gene6921-11084_t